MSQGDLTTVKAVERDPNEGKQKPAKKAGGKPRENVKQPRSVDPAKFNLLEELEFGLSSLHDLSGPFVAAEKVEDWVRVLRSHLDEMVAIAKEQAARKS